jgi:uncharacterized membrane protein
MHLSLARWWFLIIIVVSSGVDGFLPLAGELNVVPRLRNLLLLLDSSHVSVAVHVTVLRCLKVLLRWKGHVCQNLIEVG